MGAIFPIDRALVHQPHVRFVNQCRGLKRVIGTLRGQEMASEPAQLLIQHGSHLVQRPFVAIAPVYKQLRKFLRRKHSSVIHFTKN